MKKNKMMRLASVLLVCVLLTTSVISGTFAKYVTSDSAQDSARVAKWGVGVTVTGESFARAYDGNGSVTANTVVSSTNDDLLAPGTSGNFGSISITGTPEVMVDIVVKAELALTGWEINGVEYCPIVFTVGDVDYKIDANNAEMDTVAELEEAVEKAFEDLSAEEVAANTNLVRTISGSWAWDFDDSGAGTNDAKDTALGNLAAADKAPTIAFTIEATVVQVD